MSDGDVLRLYIGTITVLYLAELARASLKTKGIDVESGDQENLMPDLKSEMEQMKDIAVAASGAGDNRGGRART